MRRRRVMAKIITLVAENSFVKTAGRCVNIYLAAAGTWRPET